MTILGCKHHTGMGLCDVCSAETFASVERNWNRMDRARTLQEAARVCRSEGLFDAADTLERLASKV